MDASAPQQIDDIINQYDGWKAETLLQIRQTIKQAYPDISEEVKWKTPSRPAGLPVWTHNGIVCLVEVWKDNVKLIFPKGVHMQDSHNLFNARLKSATDRAVEFHEDSVIDGPALQGLVREAVALN